MYAVVCLRITTDRGSVIKLFRVTLPKQFASRVDLIKLYSNTLDVENAAENRQSRL